jgi:hypothetical protein
MQPIPLWSYIKLEKIIMKFSRTKQSFFALTALLIASLACSQFQASTPAATEQPQAATSVAVASPEPTQEQKPELGEILLEEDFADNANNWYVGADADTESVVEDGKFKVRVLVQDTSFSFDPPLTISDADITVDTEFTEGAPENAAYGFLCHAVDADNRYRIRISPDGTYSINKTVGAETTDLVNWTKTGAIKQGVGAVNRIHAICSENHLTLYVNDILLTDVVDADLSGGAFSLLVAAYATNENDKNPVGVSFSNLTVRTPLAWERPTGALITDAFDDNNNGWDVFEENGNSAQIENGQMVMKIVDADSVYRVWPQLALANVDMTFDVAVQEGTPSNISYGAACRFSNKDNLYSFEISGDGYYSLAKKVEGTWETIVDWTSSSVLKSGVGETNRIRIVCSDSKLEFYANDQLLISSQDTTLTGSGFALQIGRYSVDDQPVSVLFDNVTITYP